MTVEAGLNHRALAFPEDSVARKQSLAEKGAQREDLCGSAVDLPVFDQHLLQIVGMREQENVSSENAELYPVSPLT